MRALIQRVARAAVTIDGAETRSIGRGLLIFLGVRSGDDAAVIPKLADKCASLRIFEDDAGKMNLSAVELGYEALVVSNFTLYADTKKGKRPSFSKAEKPPFSEECYDAFVAELRGAGLAGVETGAFGADMQVELVNDGPVTLMLDTDEWAAG